MVTGLSVSENHKIRSDKLTICRNLKGDFGRYCDNNIGCATAARIIFGILLADHFYIRIASFVAVIWIVIGISWRFIYNVACNSIIGCDISSVIFN